MNRPLRSFSTSFLNRFLPLFFVLLFTNMVKANPDDGVTLRGIVLDDQTGTPLVSANVLIEGTRKGDATDMDGLFTLHHIHEGSIRIIASHVGYTGTAYELKVTKGFNERIEIRMEPSSFSLNPVVVTGTRTPRFIQDVPVRTEVLTSKDLEMRSAANLYEALENAPGIRVEDQCQACNFTMVRMNGLGADHTQMLMDGMPVYSGLAAVYGLEQFSSGEVDQIEIVRGAGSALYGSNAIAGAINIVTQRPVNNTIKAGIEVGNLGTRQMDATASFVQDRSAIRLFAQINEEDAIDKTRDGYTRDEVIGKDGISDRVESNLRNIGANLYFSDMAKGGDEISLRLRYLSEARYGGEMTDDLYLNPYSAGTEHIHTDRYTAALGYLLPVGRSDEVELNFSIVNHKRNATNDTYLNDYMDTHEGATPDVETMRPYLADEVMAVFSANYYKTMGNHRILTGIQLSHDEVEETGRYVIVDETDPLYGLDYTSIGKKRALDMGALIQDEWRLSPAWEMVAGVRYDVHSSEDEFSAEETNFQQVFESVTYDENSINPRVALKWAPTSSWTLRTSYGTGFKVPFGFSEDLHLCSGSPRVWKSGNLDPERSQSFSLSADYNRSGYGFSINTFATRLYGAIGITDAGETASNRGYHYEYINVDDATVFGVDLGAELPLHRTLRFSPSVSYFHGEYDNVRGDWVGTAYEDDSKYISRYPNLSGSLRLNWINAGLSGMVETQYVGEMFIDYAADGDLSNPGSKIHTAENHVLVNAQLGYTFNGGYRLYIGGKNLTDTIQKEKHVDDAAFVYGPLYGRMIYTGLRIEL